MGKPTDRMKDFAMLIKTYSHAEASELVFTDFDMCKDYIEKNKAKAYRTIREHERNERERKAERKRTVEFIGGDYGVGNNDMGIDCYDFGICPWGNS